MKHPFKVGDKVYHAVHGEVVICKLDAISQKSVKVKAPDGGDFWAGTLALSFTPWPEPNHTRPFKTTLDEGDVVVVNYGNHDEVRIRTVLREDKDWVWFTSGLKALKSSASFSRLGTPIKFN